ncbi:MAG TPA: hypothetical protein VM163_06520 [bacterium]|nr:hypothetical protein [bacterium]
MERTLGSILLECLLVFCGVLLLFTGPIWWRGLLARCAVSSSAQRVVIAVVVPIVIFLLAFGIMPDANLDPENLEESWLGWAIAVAAVGIFEFIWLGDRGGVKK